MFARCTGIVLGLVLILSGTTSQAVDLYTGEVPVADQSTRARGAAMRGALEQVLVKVTGDPEAPAAAGIDRFLANASRYAQQFQYLTERRPTEDPDAGPEQVLLLSARFDPAMVESRLREAGLPRWGQERPTVLVWLVTQDGRERRLVGMEDPVLSGTVERAARRRGLPVLFPLLDLADHQAAPERELWGGFTDSLARASARYGTETFLLSRLTGQDDDWLARWILFDRGRETQFQTRGERADVLAEGVERAAEILGQRFAVPAAERSTERLLVAVDGVRNAADYDAVMDYLGELTIVHRVQPEAAEADRLSLNVWIDAGVDRLDQVIALGQLLRPSDRGASLPSGTGLVHHRHYDLTR